MSTSDAGRFAAVVLLAVAAAVGLYQAGNAKTAPAGPTLSPTIPGDADVANGKTTAAYDDFSWRTFVALNWPADGKGQIGKGGDGVPRWEGLKQDVALLVGDGETPAPWKDPTPVPAICKGAPAAGTPVLSATSKAAPLATARMPQNGPLIDQNGAYTRYEILVNQPMYDFIRDNKLYSKAGQQGFDRGTDIDFPVGAIMLKAAWKILGKGDDPGRFHTAYAYIYNAGPSPTCAVQQVGLVGLHVSRKTASAPQWVWSTFEHVDNAPTQGQAWKGPCSYNSRTNDDQKHPWNRVPTGKWDPVDGDKQPVQVVRLTPIAPDTAALNAAYGAALRRVDAKSVFANYELVGAQYPQKRPTRANPNGEPRPAMLANSTMETFIQEDVPPVSSSCLGCHSGATMTDRRASDFTFILSRVSRR
jgi:hypothetical protein